MRPRWLLSLLLALCTLLPAELRARMIESCVERDECCCRRGERGHEPRDPELRRVDCCEAPCVADEAASAAANVPTRRELAESASATLLSPPVVASATREPVVTGPARGRDPPQRIHAWTQRWLL